MFARAADSDETIKAVLADAVLFKVDCEKGAGVELAEKFGIRAYPTFYAVNGDGETVSRWVGYGGPEAWSASVAGAKSDRRTLAAKEAAFADEPSAALARTLGAAAAAVIDLPKAVDFYRQARKMDPAGAGDDTGQIISLMQWGQRSEAFTYDDAETEAKVAMADAGMDPGVQLNAVSLLVAMARGADRIDDAVPYLKKGLAAAEKLEPGTNERAVTGLKIDHALLVEKDADKAVSLRKSTMPEGWDEHPGRLNAFAWWCFENKVNLDEALALALKGAELAEEDADRATILDTAAEICHELGNCDEAVAHMQRAVELDPDSEYYAEQLVRFEQALKEKQG